MKKMKKVMYEQPDCEVTPVTLAVIREEKPDGSLQTIIYESSTKYTVTISATKVIEHACKYLGASLEGRTGGTAEVSGKSYKLPVAIDPSSNMYFFPTASPKSKKCSWIAHSHIQQLIPKNNMKECEIVFNNGQRIHLKVSYGQMLNQIQRTAQFRYSLEGRLVQMKNLHITSQDGNMDK